jgi:hypothetical protein
MNTIKVEYKTAGEAFVQAYKLITVCKIRCKLYKNEGKWYVETTNLTNDKEQPK